MRLDEVRIGKIRLGEVRLDYFEKGLYVQQSTMLSGTKKAV